MVNVPVEHMLHNSSQDHANLKRDIVKAPTVLEASTYTFRHL